MTHREFKKIDPLERSLDTIAEIEAGIYPTTPRKQIGNVWINSGWLDRDEAIALRDWLSEALS